MSLVILSEEAPIVAWINAIGFGQALTIQVFHISVGDESIPELSRNDCRRMSLYRPDTSSNVLSECRRSRRRGSSQIWIDLGLLCYSDGALL